MGCGKVGCFEFRKLQFRNHVQWKIRRENAIVFSFWDIFMGWRTKLRILCNGPKALYIQWYHDWLGKGDYDDFPSTFAYFWGLKPPTARDFAGAPRTTSSYSSQGANDFDYFVRGIMIVAGRWKPGLQRGFPRKSTKRGPELTESSDLKSIFGVFRAAPICNLVSVWWFLHRNGVLLRSLCARCCWPWGSACLADRRHKRWCRFDGPRGEWWWVHGKIFQRNIRKTDSLPGYIGPLQHSHSFHSFSQLRL